MNLTWQILHFCFNLANSISSSECIFRYTHNLINMYSILYNINCNRDAESKVCSSHEMNFTDK